MLSRWLDIEGSRSLMLIGARRAGKTTLLKLLFPDLPYYSLDDYDLLTLARSDPKRLVQMVGDRGIIDEVQRVPELLIAVKHGIDEGGQVVLMTGSSTLGLAAQGVETLAGRIELKECPTFCWGEELGASTHEVLQMPPSPVQVAEAGRRLDAAMRFGGFPEVVLAGGEQERVDVLRNYKNTYFARDLMLMSNIEHTDALMAMMAYLAISTGSHIAPSNAAREAGVSFPTAKKYINVLVASRLAFKLYGFQYGPAKRYTRAAKYYFSDVGVLEALGVQVSQGQRLEAFVVSELEKRRLLGRFDCDSLHYYRSTGGAEIDVVIDEPHMTTAIEIKHTRSPARADLRALRTFVRQDGSKPRRGLLLHMGDEVKEVDGIGLLPVAHLWRSL